MYMGEQGGLYQMSDVQAIVLGTVMCVTVISVAVVICYAISKED